MKLNEECLYQVGREFAMDCKKLGSIVENQDKAASEMGQGDQIV